MSDKENINGDRIKQHISMPALKIEVIPPKKTPSPPDRANYPKPPGEGNKTNPKPDLATPKPKDRANASKPENESQNSGENNQSWLTEVKQRAAVGSVLIPRQIIALLMATVTPTAMDTYNRDSIKAHLLISQRKYDRALEVATGYQDYFDIYQEGKQIDATTKETAGVMLGHATGINSAMETCMAETRSGKELHGVDRVLKGVDAGMRLTSTVLVISGGVITLRKLTIVSPVFRISGRDIVVVETSLGRQAFYRSTGTSSGKPGEWFPVDETWVVDGWFNKTAYTQGPGLQEGARLHRLGNTEFKLISEKLGKMKIPKGQKVPSGVNEPAETTLNRILDFFKARTTKETFYRPVSE